MAKEIRQQIAALQSMSLEELRTKWQSVLKTPAPDCGKVFLRRQLAFQIQKNHYGGLNEETQQQIIEIGNSPKLRPNASGVVPGTRFEREWRGKKYVVVARDEGFEMDGVMYRSLSGVATAIAGTSWNGKKFFKVP